MKLVPVLVGKDSLIHEARNLKFELLFALNILLFPVNCLLDKSNLGNASFWMLSSVREKELSLWRENCKFVTG